jgi:uncharacterized protein (TIGR02453 family)
MSQALKAFGNPLQPGLFRFLGELARNNRREWFERNKARYESDVKAPALRFIGDFAAPLARISPRFRAIPSATRGSLFRIHRDVRFSKDKSPYKTHAGLHFAHEVRADVHAPGFYLHLEPGQSFVGMGIWHPDGPTLKAVREAIAADPTGWRRALSGATLRKAGLELSGDALKTAPRGFDAAHPLIEDIKRKDFVLIAGLRDADVLAPGFPKRFVETCAAGAPFVRWLCTAVGVPF